jgi:uncharacterized membrane protein
MPEIHVRESIIIKRKAGDIYRFWRNLENLPLFINHIDSIEDLGGGQNRWTIKTPVGPLSWVSEITDDKVDQIIQWRSMPGSSIQNSGSLSLEEKGSDATEATVELRYSPPSSHDSFLEDKILEVITDTQLTGDLKKFKSIMESETEVRPK